MSGVKGWRCTTAAVLALLPLAAACRPRVTEIEVVPGIVALASDPSQPTRFELEARLWTGPKSDRMNIDAGSGVKPKWSVDPANPAVHVVPSADRYRAVVTVDPGTYPTGQVKVKVKAAGLGAESVLVPSASSGQDLMEVGYTAGSRPDAAIVRGVRTDADLPCTVWLAPSLVRLGTAGLVRDPCSGSNPWAVALLDPSHGATMYPFEWTPPSVDKVPAAPSPAIRTIPVALRIFIGDGPSLAQRQDEARLFAIQEIDGAGLTLTENRAGIELHLADQQTVQPPPSGDETLASDCAMGEALTKGHDFKPGVLEIYLLDDVHGDGFACPPTNDRPMPVIYLNAGARSVNLLLHEVGHALGLTVPGSGHSEEVAGFDGSNVMAGGLVPKQGDAWRTRLTVGQVFRMNADPASWLLWAKDLAANPLRDPGAPRLECQCGAVDPPGPCPRLMDDVAKPRHGLAPTIPPRCGDLILLPTLSSVATPAAVLAGRRWRSDPGDCRHDFTGRPVYDAPTHFLEVENLTREGSCASWVVVFFQGHAPVVQNPVTLLGSWSDAADLRTLNQPLDPPIPITVQVYYNSALEAEPVAEIAEAKRVFGADGLAGLELQVFSQANPCPTISTGTYAVCHSPGGQTVTQLLGTALGLPPLTSAEQAAPGFASNVMQPSSSVSPPTLTLGQLFRIHNKVGTVGFPDCKTVPDPCPPIETDVKP